MTGRSGVGAPSFPIFNTHNPNHLKGHRGLAEMSSPELGTGHNGTPATDGTPAPTHLHPTASADFFSVREGDDACLHISRRQAAN